MSEVVGLDVFMFILELRDGQGKNLFGRKFIIPHFLEESSIFSDDILMRTAVCCIKATNVDPLVTMESNQDNGE